MLSEHDFLPAGMHHPRRADSYEPPPRPVGKDYHTPVVLFLATCVSTWISGATFFTRFPEQTPWWVLLSSAEFFVTGLWYAVPVMLILLCHEMGHYLTAHWHRVPASPPYFLPFPFSPLGTMGAVIVQPRGFGDRRTMFDIAVAGPLAGFVIAVPVAWFGVQQAVVREFVPENGGLLFGDPLLLKWMIWQTFGSLPAGHEVVLNPLLFAGWAGLFLTGLNLVPIGQLDGGHIMYALLGKRAHLLAKGMLLLGLGYMIYFQQPIYVLMVLLLLLTGIRHPPTTNDDIPLGLGRTLLGWSTMLLFFICFTPFPITQFTPEKEPRPAQQQLAPQPHADAELVSSES